MDPEDKLSRLIQVSGLFNEVSSDEEWTPENFRINDADKKLKLSGACSATNIDIYTDPSPSCSYSTPHMEEDQIGASDVELNSLSQSRPSESLVEPLQMIEEDLVTDSNVSVKNITDRKKIRLNCKTGNFETDSEESEVEEKENIKKGKKRVAKPEKWEKNIARKKKLQDHTFREINDCRCKCKDKLTRKTMMAINKKFVNFENHSQQNIYLQGCLEEIVPTRFRPRTEDKSEARNRRVFKYYVTFKGKKIELCQQAFLAVHGIKRDRLKCKVQHFEKDITDGRGRGPSKIIYTEAVIKRIHSFIENIPARASHYSRSSSKHRVYVDSHLNIATLHRDFLKQNTDLDVSVTYEKFREIFNTDFNISFAVPRKDICSTCEKFQVDIQSAEIIKDKDKVASLKSARELHLRKAEVFLKKYSSSEKEDKNMNKNKLSICFDFQKNLPLPVTNVTDEYYLRQLWLHNFGIHNLKENSATMYLFTENYAHKGPNEVITALDDYFLHHKIPDQTHLEIFCDNCFSQNKNRFIFTYFDQLCAKGLFETISVHYPIPGHSMMPIDRDFALIERQKLKHEKIYEPESYVNFVVNSRNAKKFEVVFLEKNLIEQGQIDRRGGEREEQRGNERVLKVKDYKTYYNDNIKQTIPGISGCRRVLFKRHAKPAFSDSMTGDNFKDFFLYRVGISRYIRDVPADCYQDAIKIKEAKINDIKKLIRFVPQEKRKFYETLIMEQAKLNESQIVEELDDEIE